MLSLYETIRMSVAVLNVEILQKGKTLWCNDAWLLLLSVKNKTFKKIF